MFDVTIRGILVAATMKWTRKSIGDDVIAQSLPILKPEARKPFEGMILPFQKLPLGDWDTLSEEIQRRSALKLGVTVSELERRLSREAGGEVMKVFFHALTTLFDIDAVIQRLPALHKRAYEPANCEIVNREPGRYLIRFYTSSHVQRHFRQYQGMMMAQILESCGARNATWALLKEEDANGNYMCEVEMRYESPKT